VTGQPVILLIDDNAGEKTLIAMALELAGVAAVVRTARDGIMGRDALRGMMSGEEPWCQLVILDLNMPRMDGRQLLAWVKAQDALHNLPIVIFTSSHLDSDRSDCLAAGAADYWVKPTEFADYQTLARALSTYLRKSAKAG
jgi:two-component system, chemotaxis family, response regulator Rcp1